VYSRHLIWLSLAACSSAGDRTTTDQRPAIEAAVLSAAIDAIADTTRSRVVLVIHRRVAPDVSAAEIADRHLMWQDYLRHRYDQGALPGLSPRAPFQMIGSRWEFAGPVSDTVVIGLSSAGVSSSGDEAAVYVEYACGTRCGADGWQVLRNRGGRWVVAERHARFGR
jgi:hypothetical protein